MESIMSRLWMALSQKERDFIRRWSFWIFIFVVDVVLVISGLAMLDT